MGTGTVDHLENALGDIAVTVFDHVDELVGSGTSRDLAAALQALEQAKRQLHAAEAALVGAVDHAGLFLEDQHRSVKAWVLASTRVTPGEAVGLASTAKLLAKVPAARDAMRAGHLGVAQARDLAGAIRNPRAGDVVAAVADTLIEWATTDDYETFRSRLGEFVGLVDQDGAHRGSDETHRARSAQLSQVGDQWVLRGQFGVLQGDALRQVFDAFVNAEWHADFDAARQQLGPDVSPAEVARHLARTDAQRRADALIAMCEAAAIAPLDGKTIDVTVNVVIDQKTFEQQLVELLDPLHRHGITLGASPHRCGIDDRDLTLDLPTGQPRLCRLESGTPVDTREAVTAALVGHVRRVVIGADGVIIDLGRRSRCFTGSARHAAFLQAALDGTGRRCLWPGCRHSRPQIDHVDEWHDHGVTNPHNCGPLCGKHNRVKTSGYTTRRDPTGRWHTHRPDGTEIVAA